MRPDSTIRTLADVEAGPLGSPGLQSWATATARATLRAAAPKQEPVFVTTRFQEAVPLMVQLKTAEVGITRSKKLVDDYVGQKMLRVVHTTPALPLNALIAAPKIPKALISEMRDALGAMTHSKAFEPLGLKGLHYSAEESQRLNDFYQ